MTDLDFRLKNGLIVASNATVGGSIVMDTVKTSVSSNIKVYDNSTVVVDSSPINVTRSIRYQMQAVCDNSYQTSWILLVHNGVTSYLTEYAIVSSIDLPLVSFTTEISNGNVRLLGIGNFGTSYVWFQKTSIDTAATD